MRDLVDLHEQIDLAIRRFRRAEEQEAARPERKVERLDQPLLDRAIQINEQVAAGDEIEVRERRIADHVVMREQHRLAQLPSDAVAASLTLEKPLETLGADV